MQEATNNATGNTTDWAGWGTAGSAVGAYFDGVLSGIAQHGELGLESASRIIGRMSAMIDVGVFAGPALARAAVDGRFNEEFIAQGTSFVGSVAGMRIGLRSGAWLGAKLGSVTFGPEVAPAASVIGGFAGAVGGVSLALRKHNLCWTELQARLAKHWRGPFVAPTFRPKDLLFPPLE